MSALSPTITDHSPSPTYALKNYYRSLISKFWHLLWQIQHQNKLRSTKNKPIPWSSATRISRHEEVILSRLRIGHTRLTHSHLLQGLHTPASCNYCHEDNLTVQHLFLCPALQNLRATFNVSSSISSALFNNSEKISNSLSYLRSTYCFLCCAC